MVSQSLTLLRLNYHINNISNLTDKRGVCMGGYDVQAEKLKIYTMLQPTIKEELQEARDRLKVQATEISMDELEELDKEFKVFQEKVSHLSIYEHLYKDVIVPYWSKLGTDAQHLIHKDYTPEELEMMPREAYNHILNQQRIRLSLIQSIIRNYNLRK